MMVSFLFFFLKNSNTISKFILYHFIFVLIKKFTKMNGPAYSLKMAQHLISSHLDKHPTLKSLNNNFLHLVNFLFYYQNIFIGAYLVFFSLICSWSYYEHGDVAKIFAFMVALSFNGSRKQNKKRS